MKTIIIKTLDYDHFIAHWYNPKLQFKFLIKLIKNVYRFMFEFSD